MKRWRKSLLALAILSTFVAFGYLHSNSKFGAKDSSSVNESARSPKSEKAPPTKEDLKKIENKEITETQPVEFQSVTEDDRSMPTGSSEETVHGVNGVKSVTYSVTYVDGQEIAREKLSEVVIKQPVNKVTKIGKHAVEMQSASRGPAGATALCADGFLSYARHHQGACSFHGGVSLWYE
jgi:hypothetical protein